MSYFTGPAYRLLEFWAEATPRPQLRSDPLCEEHLLDLASWESVCKVTNEADGELDGAFRPFAVSQASLAEVEHALNVRQEKTGLVSVLEGGDDANVGFENALAKRLYVLDELDVKLQGELV